MTYPVTPLQILKAPPRPSDRLMRILVTLWLAVSTIRLWETQADTSTVPLLTDRDANQIKRLEKELAKELPRSPNFTKKF